MSSRAATVILGFVAALIAGFVGFQLGGAPARAVEWRDLRAPEGEGGGARADELSDLRLAVDQLRRGVPEGMATLPVPDTPVTLLGQTVPLDRADVREDLAYELILTIGRPLMPMLWLRRSHETLPLIQAQLAKAALPDDLKYVAMIESDLRWMVTSPAGAEGLWQIMPETAKRFGLQVNAYIDERRDPDRASEAATAYLKKLHEEFGDWFLAAAAYNAGEGRVREALSDQGARPYFDLYLPRETRRYVLRILAAKLVHEDPVRYGLAPIRPIWIPEYRYVEVQVKGQRADLHTLAAEHGIDYAALRIANPQLRGSTLPKGTYRLRVLVNGFGSVGGGN